MAKASGSGTVDLKLSLLAGLLAGATPKEAKYVMRTATGNLRLGIADMTVLDALAIAYGGGKESRECIERACNICSDLRRVAKTVAEKGTQGAKRFQVSIGEPIRPMLAERLSSPEEILEKLGRKCIAENTSMMANGYRHTNKVTMSHFILGVWRIFRVSTLTQLASSGIV
jgi:DNA ligase-1